MARDGVVILGRGVTVLRYYVWAMSAPRVLWAHFMLCHFHSLTPSESTGVLWVLTRTHLCDDSPRQGGEPSQRQLVLWIVEWTGVCS